MKFFRAFSNYQTTTVVLFWYWLISAVLYLLYQGLVSSQSSFAGGASPREILEDPPVALAFVAACSSVILAALLKVASGENVRTLRVFAVFAIIQQLASGNVIGAVLAYVLIRFAPRNSSESFAPSRRWLLVGGMILISLVTVLFSAAQLHLLFS